MCIFQTHFCDCCLESFLANSPSCELNMTSNIISTLIQAVGWCPVRQQVVTWTNVTAGSLNSLAPGKFEWNFIYVIFKLILVIDGWGISCEIALIWMLMDFTDDQSTLVQVMAWCRHATSHYLSQCWPKSLSPYGVTRPQWVNADMLSEDEKCEDATLKLSGHIHFTVPIEQ